MHAVVAQVRVENYDPTMARDELNTMAIPMVRDSGAVAAHWLEPIDGRVTAITLYADGEQARQAADSIKIGSQAGSDPGTTFESVEVREVLAHF